MEDFLNRLFKSDFMPHGYCWSWEPWVVWTNVVSDMIIFLSYLIIGSTLLKVTSQRKDVLSNPVVALFGAFIVCCGCTHAMEVFNTWNGLFRLAGVIKMATATVSLLTVGPLMEILPKVVSLPALGDILKMKVKLSSEQQDKNRMAGQLRESEDRFRLLVEGIKDYAIFLVDPQGLITSWNPGGERIMGYSSREILGQPFSRFFPGNEIEAGLPGERLRQAAEGERLEDEGWRVRKDGSLFLAAGVVNAFYDTHGAVKGFAGVIRDITEQRANEAVLQSLAERLEDQVRARVQDLRESEARLQGFIRHSPAVIAFKGLDGRYLLVNPQMETAFHLTPDHILGRTDEELFSSQAATQARDRDRRVLQSGQALQVEEQWTHGDGSNHHYLVNAFPLGQDAEQSWGLGIIATDITGRKEADRALLQSQKLESLGVLAGGIAHDFNNILGAMQGNVELAELTDSREQAMSHLATLKGLMARGADLLSQLMAYAGRGKFKVCTVDLNQLVEDLTHLLGTSISKKARLVKELHPQLPTVVADPSQLQQVVMNLVINASEAIGDQPGTILLSTSLQRLGPEDMGGFARTLSIQPGLYVALEVTDSGAGMTPDVIKKIFDPFFTTKFTGRGLGLAAIHGIVRSHQGSIQVLSAPGKGSTFRVLLPAGPELALGDPLQADQAASALARAPKRATVLVVDDEPAMRFVLVKALEHWGFTTLQAWDGQDALDVFWANQDQIKLILMDLTMPVLDGVEACRELRHRGVRIPVLLSSGFDESAAVNRFEGLGISGFIKKPFQLAAVVAQIQALLAD